MTQFNPTQEQLQVIHHEGGHALVAAVAGSGKSATLVARIIHLLQQGVPANRILVLMFNRSACDDFTARLHAACMQDWITACPEVFTFHGFGSRLIDEMQSRRDLDVWPLCEDDNSTTRHQLAREVLHQFNAEIGEQEKLDVSADTVFDFLRVVDALKGELYQCSGADDAAIAALHDRRFVTAFERFESLRRERGIRFYSDLIYDPVKLAIQDANWQTRLSGRYDHVLIDEFQDSNESQMALLRMLAAQGSQVMGVGDDDQTIYVWRGAKPQYLISKFEEEFPGTTRYTLSRTFRYGHALALMANNVITRNTVRTDKICVSGTSRKTNIDLRFSSPKEPHPILDTVTSWTRGNRSLNEIAVLVRQFSMAASSEVALLRNGIPYYVEGAKPFFQRRETLGLCGYLHLATGGFEAIDDIERRRAVIAAMLCTPNMFLKQSVVHDIATQAAERPDQLINLFAKTLSTKGMPLFQAARLRLALDCYRWCMTEGKNKSAFELLHHVWDFLDIAACVERENPVAETVTEKLRMMWTLVKMAGEFKSSPQDLLAFLDKLGAYYDGLADGGERIVITSIHRYKGLEKPHVIMPELAEGVFPAMKLDGLALEDERRLFYVGITRATEQLTLIAPVDPTLIAMHRFGNATVPKTPMKASRFLYESNVAFALTANGVMPAGGLRPDAHAMALKARYDEICGVEMANAA